MAGHWTKKTHMHDIETMRRILHENKSSMSLTNSPSARPLTQFSCDLACLSVDQFFGDDARPMTVAARPSFRIAALARLPLRGRWSPGATVLRLMA